MVGTGKLQLPDPRTPSGILAFSVGCCTLPRMAFDAMAIGLWRCPASWPAPINTPRFPWGVPPNSPTVYRHAHHNQRKKGHTMQDSISGQLFASCLGSQDAIISTLAHTPDARD